MPQKWSCSCGQQVPINLSFCGSCGKRWDKVARNQTNVAQKAKKQESSSSDTTDKGMVGFEFNIPSVGLSLPSLPLQSSNAASVPVQQKTFKTILHQRANRIGKLEVRIRKLEQGIQEVQTNWPQYVHRMQQQLQHEHQRCVTFHAQAHTELTSLRQELQELVQGQAMPSLSDMSMHMYGQDQPTSRIQEALQVLHAAGIGVPSSYAAPPMTPDVPMQSVPDVPAVPPVPPGLQTYVHLPTVDAPTPAATPQCSQASGTPSVAATLQPSPAVQASGTGMQAPPPGNWAWPPVLPTLPTDLSIGSTGQSSPKTSFPNPLYQALTEPPPTSCQPELNVQQCVQSAIQHTGAPLLDTAVQQVVHQAAAGLVELCHHQGTLSQDGLPPEIQEMLNQFTVQQAQCHEQLQQLKTSVVPPSQVGPKPAAFSHPKPVPVSGDAHSIHSSPGGAEAHGSNKHLPERFLLSPDGQRDTKIPKTVDASVHFQPVNAKVPLHAGLTTPLPESSSPRTPTPVPTEVPSSDPEDEPRATAAGKVGHLQQLE